VGNDGGACNDGKGNEKQGRACSWQKLQFLILIGRYNDSETDPVIDAGRGTGRRLCVFCDGLRGRVPGLLKRIFACDGLRVPVKELALGVDV